MNPRYSIELDRDSATYFLTVYNGEDEIAEFFGLSLDDVFNQIRLISSAF